MALANTCFNSTNNPIESSANASSPNPVTVPTLHSGKFPAKYSSKIGYATYNATIVNTNVINVASCRANPSRNPKIPNKRASTPTPTSNTLHSIQNLPSRPK